jgi:hybrid cluster-associated redox disulfide protein
LRKRKEGFELSLYLGGMDTQIIHAQLVVEDVFKKWPQTFSVFRSRNADCIGCLMQRFCTLEDVARIYDLDLQALTNDLSDCVNQNHLSQRSTL